MKTITPTSARKDLYSLIKDVVSTSEPVEIINIKQENESVVMVSKADWDAIQETLYLQQVGVIDQIKKYKNEESVDLGEIDWDTM